MRSFTERESFFPTLMVVNREMNPFFSLLVALLLTVVMGLFPSFAAEEASLEHWAKVLANGKADTHMRLDAAKRLGEAKDPKYLQYLTETLKDGNKAVRWAAVEALWELGDKRAVPSLIEYLEKGEAYEWGKVLTMNALASLRDARAISPLLKMIESKNPFLRRSAALALVKIGDGKAIPGIIELLKDEEGWLQRLAQDLLLELTKGTIPGEAPSGYEEWMKWYQGSTQRLKIEAAKKQ